MNDHCDATGKIIYKSRAKANKAGAALKSRHGFRDSKQLSLTAFECRACGHWHLGNTLTGKPKPKTEWHPAP